MLIRDLLYRGSTSKGRLISCWKRQHQTDRGGPNPMSPPLTPQLSCKPTLRVTLAVLTSLQSRLVFLLVFSDHGPAHNAIRPSFTPFCTHNTACPPLPSLLLPADACPYLSFSWGMIQSSKSHCSLLSCLPMPQGGDISPLSILVSWASLKSAWTHFR